MFVLVCPNPFCHAMVAIQQVSLFLKIRCSNCLLVPVKVCKSSKRPDMIAREQKTPRLPKDIPACFVEYEPASIQPTQIMRIIKFLT